MSAPECPRCYGEGTVYVYDAKGTFISTVQCGRCNGTGVDRE